MIHLGPTSGTLMKVMERAKQALVDPFRNFHRLQRGGLHTSGLHTFPLSYMRTVTAVNHQTRVMGCSPHK